MAELHGIAQTSDTVQWRPEYKLRWEDFQGAPENDRWAAMTYCTLDCLIFSTGDSIEVFSSCYFSKIRSWVHEYEKDPNLLSHEQGHFDNCALFARKFLSRASSLKNAGNI